jgi:hypothetical protein
MVFGMGGFGVKSLAGWLWRGVLLHVLFAEWFKAEDRDILSEVIFKPSNNYFATPAPYPRGGNMQIDKAMSNPTFTIRLYTDQMALLVLEHYFRTTGADCNYVQ